VRDRTTVGSDVAVGKVTTLAPAAWVFLSTESTAAGRRTVKLFKIDAEVHVLPVSPVNEP